MPRTFIAKLEDREVPIEIEPAGGSLYRVRQGEGELLIDARRVAGGLSLLIDGKNHEVSLARSADDYDVLLENRRFRFRLLSEDRAAARRRARHPRVDRAARGQGVDAGQGHRRSRRGRRPGRGEAGPLVIEAMKMENEIKSQGPGEVKEIHVKPGPGGRVGRDSRRPRVGDSMTTELEVGLYIFILAGFLGYHVITRVPPLLHTPLMSATNAISGISLIGSLVVAGAMLRPAQHVPRLRRRRLLLDQRGRRLPHHRPHAQDVQERATRPTAARRLSERVRAARRRRCWSVGVIGLLFWSAATQPSASHRRRRCCATCTSSRRCCSSWA